MQHSKVLRPTRQQPRKPPEAENMLLQQKELSAIAYFIAKNSCKIFISILYTTVDTQRYRLTLNKF